MIDCNLANLVKLVFANPDVGKTAGQSKFLGELREGGGGFHTGLAKGRRQALLRILACCTEAGSA
jgi:hypothetical protein